MPLRSFCRLTALALPLSVASCLHTTNTEGTSAVTQVACGAFRPITYSRLDTEQTVRQIRGHNAAFEVVCPDA